MRIAIKLISKPSQNTNNQETNINPPKPICIVPIVSLILEAYKNEHFFSKTKIIRQPIALNVS